ncbi:hypothetical protein TcG_12487 [Trypanosoma cruzi]|nr:hypothetical protein TcG_12487 [Trypanosoma cruzi]
MINTSLADGSLRSCWKTGTPLPSANTGRMYAALRGLPAYPAALCPARGLRGTGPPPPVSGKMSRGLRECINVECERRRGGVLRCTVVVTALSPSRSASQLH